MDDDFDLLLHTTSSYHQLEVDEESEFLDQARLLIAVLIVGSNEDHALSSSWYLGVLPEGENPKPVGLLSV